MDGLRRLLDFTNYLKENKVMYKIEQTSPDELMVTFATIGKRVEVYFTPDEVLYSVFLGDEGVFDDMNAVRKFIEEFNRE